MSKYIYKLHDYHAVKEAEISIDGITVLAGINGCGKSTLSRWLYFLINGSYNYDQYLFDEFKKKICGWLDRIDVVVWDIGQRSDNDKIQEALSKLSIDDLVGSINKLTLLPNQSVKSIDEVESMFNYSLFAVDSILNLYFADQSIPDARKERIRSYLFAISGVKNDEPISLFVKEMGHWFNILKKQLINNINTRPKDSFFELIQQRFDESGDFPSFVQLEEDGVDIIEDNRISAIFNLHRAIYIDTPMSITTDASNNVFWNALRDKMFENKEMLSEQRKLLRRINGLLDGEARLTSNNITEKKELRYVSNDKLIDIPLKEAATGFKTFSYLQRLLENGYLTSETLLMIDEPEAHLHPQWIVDFARLLVLLNKEFGVKVMIASHNPDMVAAIQAIARKEGVLDNTNFYLAKPCDNSSHQYVYNNLGSEIGEIFESFNIALDRINQYG